MANPNTIPVIRMNGSHLNHVPAIDSRPLMIIPSDIIPKLDFSQVPRKCKKSCRDNVLRDLNQTVLSWMKSNYPNPDFLFTESELIVIGQNFIKSWLERRTKGPSVVNVKQEPLDLNLWRQHIIDNYVPTRDCVFPFGVFMDAFRKMHNLQLSTAWDERYAEFLRSLSLRVEQGRINLDPSPKMLTFLDHIYHRDISQRPRLATPERQVPAWFVDVDLVSGMRTLSITEPLAMPCPRRTTYPRVLLYDEPHEDQIPRVSVCPGAPKKLPIYRTINRQSLVCRRLDFDSVMEED